MKPKTRRILVLIFLFVIFAFSVYNFIPVFKNFNPPSYVPDGYRVAYDNKESVGRSITLRDSGDKHYIKLTSLPRTLDICNGEEKTLLNTKVCWGLQLPDPKPDEFNISWNKNGSLYLISTNDNLTETNVAKIIDEVGK